MLHKPPQKKFLATEKIMNEPVWGSGGVFDPRGFRFGNRASPQILRSQSNIFKDLGRPEMSRKKPPELKALAGTTRPDRAPVIALSGERLTVTPEPPGWLPNEHALREWNLQAPGMVACGILTPAMVSPLAHYCSLHGLMVARWRSPDKPPTAALCTSYRQFAASFGLFPTATASTAPKKPNAFAALKEPK
jgi:hypothetical protein